MQLRTSYGLRLSIQHSSLSIQQCFRLRTPDYLTPDIRSPTSHAEGPPWMSHHSGGKIGLKYELPRPGARTEIRTSGPSPPMRCASVEYSAIHTIPMNEYLFWTVAFVLFLGAIALLYWGL